MQRVERCKSYRSGLCYAKYCAYKEAGDITPCQDVTDCVLKEVLAENKRMREALEKAKAMIKNTIHQIEDGGEYAEIFAKTTENHLYEALESEEI
jgi:hypothetical protein